jgi:hypothetical protein
VESLAQRDANREGDQHEQPDEEPAAPASPVARPLSARVHGSKSSAPRA